MCACARMSACVCAHTHVYVREHAHILGSESNLQYNLYHLPSYFVRQDPLLNLEPTGLARLAG